VGGGGLTPRGLSRWDHHKKALSVPAEGMNMRANSGEATPVSRWVEVWPFWVSSVWLLSRLMQLHGRGEKRPSITICLEMAFECRDRH